MHDFLSMAQKHVNPSYINQFQSHNRKLINNYIVIKNKILEERQSMRSSTLIKMQNDATEFFYQHELLNNFRAFVFIHIFWGYKFTFMTVIWSKGKVISRMNSKPPNIRKNRTVTEQIMYHIVFRQISSNNK